MRVMNVLPVYKGYTVDNRLKQFRKCPIDDMMEFIEFDSEKGSELLEEMMELDFPMDSVPVDTPLGQQFLKELNLATYGKEAA